MKEQLISFETAKLLTHTEFNPKACHEGYVIATGDLSSDYTIDWFNKKAIGAPTQSLLQKWLREVHGIHVSINPRYSIKLGENLFYSYDISTAANNYCGLDVNLDRWLGWDTESGVPDLYYHVYKSYEEALEFGLQEGLNLIL